MRFPTVRNLVGHYPWASKARSALIVLVQNSIGKDMRRGPTRISQNFPNCWMRAFLLLLGGFQPYSEVLVWIPSRIRFPYLHTTEKSRISEDQMMSSDGFVI
ncbi:hypothetical protein QE152_g895 [Popillia japonica]|uniref:Uncharacterized protein n=1 Tax=Popillia japonica TaxID=7064 RepID=A0AAW1N4P0_POPJA